MNKALLIYTNKYMCLQVDEVSIYIEPKYFDIISKLMDIAKVLPSSSYIVAKIQVQVGGKELDIQSDEEEKLEELEEETLL